MTAVGAEAQTEAIKKLSRSPSRLPPAVVTASKPCHEFSPRFLRRYLSLYDEIGNAVKAYIADVKSGDFPNKDEQY